MGHTEVVGNWGPTSNHVANVQVATNIAAGGLVRVGIQTTAGRRLLGADVAA